MLLKLIGIGNYMLCWLLIHLSRLVLRVMLYDEPATMSTLDVHLVGLFTAGFLFGLLGLFTAAHMGLCAIRHVFSFGSIFFLTLGSVPNKQSSSRGRRARNSEVTPLQELGGVVIVDSCSNSLRPDRYRFQKRDAAVGFGDRDRACGCSRSRDNEGDLPHTKPEGFGLKGLSRPE
jgi:hypothetical protein